MQASSVEMSSSHRVMRAVQVEDRLEVRAAAAPPANSGDPFPADSIEITDPKEILARWLFEFATGRKAAPIRRVQQGHARAVNAAPSWSVSYTHRETRTEAESTSFSASGTVKLASGAEIRFSLQLQMQRQETETSSLTFQAGNMTDPIVVNLDGAGARLTADREAFDLDSDGDDEMIARLAEGSAWLGRDANGNGTIDNGSELFGPATGNGFRELAALDGDGNRWIDEGDAVYSQLGLWRDGTFISLAEAGVGALSVDSVRTPFTVKQGAELLGEVNSSGVYLRAGGAAGLLQQIDLAV